MTLRPEPYREIAEERTFDRLEALGQAARARGVDMATVALAWVLGDPRVTSVVVGPRRPSHLDPALAGVALELSPGEREEIGALFA